MPPSGARHCAGMAFSLTLLQQTFHITNGFRTVPVPWSKRTPDHHALPVDDDCGGERTHHIRAGYLLVFIEQHRKMHVQAREKMLDPLPLQIRRDREQRTPAQDPASGGVAPTPASLPYRVRTK